MKIKLFILSIAILIMILTTSIGYDQIQEFFWYSTWDNYLENKQEGGLLCAQNGGKLDNWGYDKFICYDISEQQCIEAFNGKYQQCPPDPINQTSRYFQCEKSACVFIP